MPSRPHLGAALTSAGAGLLVLAAFAGPSSAGPIGADPCPAGTVLVAKFEAGDGYHFERPLGNEDVVTIDDAASADGGTWSSTTPIAAVVVKGGSSELSVDIDWYDPPATSGTFSNEDLLNDGGQVPDISFVAFCEGTGTTTTSSSTTTSSTAPTSTTDAPTTTGAPTTALVLPNSITNATTSTTAATQVLGTQLARTGGTQSATVVAGTALLLSGAVLLLRAKRSRSAS